MGTMEEMNGRRDKTIGVSHSDGGGREDAGKMTFKLTRRQGIYHVVSPIPMTLNGTYTFRHKFRNRMQSPDQNSLLHAKPSS